MTFTLDSDLKGQDPQFTLTCTSTGGPATTVTWTRDSETVSRGITVLNDPVTAQYTHTLTVTQRLGGQYRCTVSNNKPSQDIASLTVQGMHPPTTLAVYTLVYIDTTTKIPIMTKPRVWLGPSLCFSYNVMLFEGL